VAALEGRFVFLEKVGNHDETERWGERASLSEYEKALRQVQSPTAGTTLREGADPDAALFGETLTLPQIVENEELVSDLLAGDVAGALEGYIDGVIEDWMIFLSPLQRRAVQRAVHGPARVSGGPGTGKTVVALHRAAALARSAPSSRLLMTSFVNTIPDVLRNLFARLAPAESERVEFVSIHALANRVLAERGLPTRVDNESARRRFNEALMSEPARREALRRAGFNDDYVWEEISRVIQSRNVDSVAEYLTLARYGRQQPMQQTERRLAWSIYEDYISRCERASPPLMDWTSQLARAEVALADRPEQAKYDAIIVDEAQDITAAGLRLLLGLLEGGAGGQLLLVGDNAQRIYAGGFRLADIGVHVRGRSFILEHCYRSTDEIMQAAGLLGRFLSTEDFGEDGNRSVTLNTVRSGPRPILRDFPTTTDEQKWVIGAVRESADRASVAVLVSSNSLVEKWVGRFEEAGIESCPLLNYHGTPTPGVKVGTYNRAKGLEFKRVILPNLSKHAIAVDTDRVDDLIKRGSQFYVALTRARDQLDLSFSGEPSPLLDPLLAAVDLR
jgi:superfamily I DNA/RNA helicase